MEVPPTILQSPQDNPRGFSITPTVRVLATASPLRAFQPQSRDSIHGDYSGLRPIYATQSHPKMLTLAHIQSLSGAKLRSGNAPAPKASGWPRPQAEPRSGRKSPREHAERDAPVAKRSGWVSEANCEAAARPRASAERCILLRAARYGGQVRLRRSSDGRRRRIRPPRKRRKPRLVPAPRTVTVTGCGEGVNVV